MPALAGPAHGLVSHRMRAFAPTLRASRIPAGRSRTVTCLASFIPDSVDDVLTTGTIVVSGLAILGTAALAARSPKRPPPPDEEGFQYGIMSVVSCIPLFSWTAWVLPALERPDRAALYYTYAALYCYPLIKDGFDIEAYTLIMLLLGIVHVQVERIANTEPETFQDIKPLAAALGVVGLLAEQVVNFFGSVVGIMAKDTQQAVRGGRGEADSGRLMGGDESPQSSSEDVDSLKEFDRRMLAREADKRRRQNKGKGN